MHVIAAKTARLLAPPPHGPCIGPSKRHGNRLLNAINLVYHTRPTPLISKKRPFQSKCTAHYQPWPRRQPASRAALTECRTCDLSTICHTAVPFLSSILRKLKTGRQFLTIVTSTSAFEQGIFVRWSFDHAPCMHYLMDPLHNSSKIHSLKYYFRLLLFDPGAPSRHC